MTAWTSGLSVAEAAALRQARLVPVGHVFGASVFHIGWSGTAYCGGDEPGILPAEEWRGSRAAGEWGGFGAVVAALRKVRRRALDQVRADAAALGADGVVGVQLELLASDDDRRAVQFTAFGTAVRSDGDTHAKRPFLCSLSAVEAVQLMLSGWVPVDVALGVAVEIEHDDADSRAVLGARGVLKPNAEVPSLTRLVTRARTEAARTLQGEVSRMGADGAVVSTVSLEVTRSRCEVYKGKGFHDHVAQAVVIGTGIAAVSAGAQRATASRPVRRTPAKRAATRRGHPEPRHALSVLPLRPLAGPRPDRPPAAPPIGTWLD